MMYVNALNHCILRQDILHVFLPVLLQLYSQVEELFKMWLPRNNDFFSCENSKYIGYKM